MTVSRQAIQYEHNMKKVCI